MIRTLFTLAFAALLFGCATRPTKVPSTPPTFASLLSQSPYPAIKTAIDTLLPDTLFPPSNVGIQVVSLGSGETVYELNPDMLFNPASNEKLFTAAAALSVLGEDHPYTAAGLNNMGGLLQTLGDLQGARPYFQRALAILQRRLPPGHQNTATVAANLAALEREMKG